MSLALSWKADEAGACAFEGSPALGCGTGGKRAMSSTLMTRGGERLKIGSWTAGIEVGIEVDF
jgi:hypothetical protein